MAIVVTPTTVSIGDLVIIRQNLFLIILQRLGLITLTNWLLTSILRYLDSKPMGKQSIMDIGHRGLLTSIKFISITGNIFFIVVQGTEDSGHILAKILMWPVYDCSSNFFIHLMINPIIQIALTRWPHLELPFSDDTAYYILMMITFVPMAIVNLILDLCGYNPPPYNLMRKWAVVHTQFWECRRYFIITACCLVIIMRIGLFMYRMGCCQRKTGNNSQTIRIKGTKQMLSNTVLIMSGMFLVLLSFFIQKTPYFILDLALYVFSVTLPILLIISNSSIRDQVLRGLPCTGPMLDLWTKIKPKNKVQPQARSNDVEMGIISKPRQIQASALENPNTIITNA